jgi:hypothetical protein
MRVRSYVFALVLASPAIAALSAFGCNNVIVPDGDSDTSVGGSGGFSTSTLPTNTVTTGPNPDATSDFEDPGCPNKPDPIYDYQCDPYNQQSGACFNGEGCYIYVQYPSEPCGQEIYGAVCLPAGPGGQGDPCGGPQDCGSGHACVVTGSGTQCVKLCPLEGMSTCPSGFVCEPIDVDGFGGCL